MAEEELSHPPSQPRPRASRPGADAGPESEAPPRAQLVAMGLLGLVLVAVPLNLSRRPRPLEADPEVAAAQTEEPPPAAVVAVAPKAEVPAGPRIVVGTARVLECHDRGSHKTAPADCDHLPVFEKQLSDAIASQGSCVPATAGGGTLAYVADVSYARKKKPVSVTVSKDGGTLKNAKVASACASAVGHALSAATLDEKHAHARYKIELIATYP
jgi:hypothetical protein